MRVVPARTRRRAHATTRRAHLAAAPTQEAVGATGSSDEEGASEAGGIVLTFAFPVCCTKTCIVRNVTTICLALALGIALFIVLRDADAQPAAGGALASLLAPFARRAATARASAVPVSDAVLLRAREQARLGAISRIDESDVPPPRAPYTYGGVFASPRAVEEGEGTEPATPRTKARRGKARRGEGAAARVAGRKEGPSEGAPRDTATLQRCLCETDRWGFDAHTTDHWPKRISLSAKGVNVVERYCAADDAKQRPTRLRNTVIGVLARTTHMRKSALQRQCEKCLAVLACEAVDRVRNPRLRGEVRRERGGQRKERKAAAGHHARGIAGSSTSGDGVEQFRVIKF